MICDKCYRDKKAQPGTCECRIHSDESSARPAGCAADDIPDEARKHALALEQCSLFVDAAHLAAAMTDAAALLRRIAVQPNDQR